MSIYDEILGDIGLPTVRAVSSRRQRSSYSPEEEQSILSTLGNHALSGIAAVGNVLDIPGSMLRDELRKVSNPPGEMIDGGDQARVTAMLKALKDKKKINYNGVAGPCDFDKNGDVITPVNIWKYTGDKIETGDMDCGFGDSEHVDAPHVRVPIEPSLHAPGVEAIILSARTQLRVSWSSAM